MGMRHRPCCLRPGGAGLLFSPFGQTEGDGAPVSASSWMPPCGGEPSCEDSRLPALHRGGYGPGRAFDPAVRPALVAQNRPSPSTVSRLPAGTGKGPGRCPVPPADETDVRPRPRAPHPVPPSERLMMTPFGTDRTLRL